MICYQSSGIRRGSPGPSESSSFLLLCREITGTTMPVIFLLCFVLLFSLSGTGTAAGQSLTLWIHPYLPATELTKRFSPLASHLEASLGLPVEIRVQKSYQAHLDFVGRDLADFAYVGPASYIQITEQYGRKPLLAKLEVSGMPFFHGMIVVRQDSPIQELADLKAKSFAFGDPNSTMSYFAPRSLLAAAGVPLESLARHDYLGSHHDVALAVLGGYFDAGAVKQEVFYAYEKRGLKIVAQSPPIPPHLFLTRADLPPSLVAGLRAALLDINSLPGKAAVLKVMEESATDLLPVLDSDYDGLRQLMNELAP
jgi:phosphonate transport system substrate-binding protein